MHIGAVIYIPSADLKLAAVACLEYVAACGYQMAGIVVGRWNDAQSLALDGTVDVVVVAERSHLPPDRVPRIEVVAEQRQEGGAPPSRDSDPDDDAGPPTPPRRRRPRRIE